MKEIVHTCTRCKVQKDDAEFPRAKGRRHSWCRACHRESNKEYRDKQREKTPRKVRIASDMLSDDGRGHCKRCGEWKPLTEFAGGKVSAYCRPCRAAYEGSRRRAAGVEPKTLSRLAGNYKLCLGCHTMLHTKEFSPSARGLGGVSSYCRSCAKTKFYNKDRARQATAQYRKVNRERYLALHRVSMFRRRYRVEVASDGTVDDEFLKSLYATEMCSYCGRYTDPADRTADHVVPLANGGPHSASNLVMACRSCNSSKRDLSVEEFQQRRKRYENSKD